MLQIILLIISAVSTFFMALIGRALISLQRTSADSIKVARDDRDHYRELWLTDQKNYTKEVAALRAELRQLEGQLDLTRETKADLQRELEQERVERRAEKQEFEVRIANLNRDNTALQAQVVDLTEQVNELRNQLATLTSNSSN